MIYKDAVGDIISLDTQQNLAGATKMEIHVVRPDGTTTTWTAIQSAPGILQHVTVAGDVSQAGPYLLTAYVEWDTTSKHPGDAYILQVRETGYNAASYTNNPAGRKIDAVRLELGKDISLELVTDNEITYQLGRANQNVYFAAAFCAETIAGLYAGYVDKSMGGSSVSLSQKAENWRKKAEALRSQAMHPSITPRATSSAPKALKFAIGQHDYPTSSYYAEGFL